MAKKSVSTGNSDDSEKIEVKTLKVNDISKPGETPSLPTSRPIITSRTGMIKQDPMVSGKPNNKGDENDEVEQPEEDSEKLAKKSSIKLKPIDEPEDKPEDNEDKPEEPKPEEQDEPEESKPGERDEPPKQNEEETPEEDDTSTSDSAAIDSLATNAETKKPSSKEAEEEQKKAEKIQELIASKKYYAPIREGGHKASSQRVMSWIFLILLLLAVGLYLAIDAGYLDVGISLPFDLIKN